MDGAGAGAADSGSTELAIAPLGAALADNGEAGDASEGGGSRDRSGIKGERAEKQEQTNRKRSPLRGFSAALLPKDGSWASLTIPLALVALLVLGGGCLSARYAGACGSPATRPTADFFVRSLTSLKRYASVSTCTSGAERSEIHRLAVQHPSTR